MTEINQDLPEKNQKESPAPILLEPQIGLTPPRKTKRTYFRGTLYTLVVALVIYFSTTYLANTLLEPAGFDPNPVTVNIPQGANTGAISQILWTEGLIKNPTTFKLYSRLKGFDSKLKAGEYLIASTMSTPEILETIVGGSVATFSFTIPEGYNTRQIADLLAAKGFINRERFMELVAQGNFNYDFLAGLPQDEQRLEGYLFPETYQMGIGFPEEKVIETMLQEFKRKLPGDFAEQGAKLGLSLREAVVIASIIEREAKKPEEQPLISAVIHNRLKKNMRLEIDATVQYLFPKQKARVYYKDLQIDSPYNTYRYAGLPPGPIASPGRGALVAAVNPAPVNYLYFVVKGDGGHVFTDKYKTHLANIKKYRK